MEIALRDLGSGGKSFTLFCSSMLHYNPKR